MTNLAAIGLERARGQAATTRAEAARQSSELRLRLDAAAHEFKTPLTSMKAAAIGASSTHQATDPRRELVEIVNEDLVAAEALVTDAIQMLRIDSGDFVVNGARHRSPISSSRRCRNSTTRLQGQPSTTTLPDDSPWTRTGTC